MKCYQTIEEILVQLDETPNTPIFYFHNGGVLKKLIMLSFWYETIDIHVTMSQFNVTHVLLISEEGSYTENLD